MTRIRMERWRRRSGGRMCSIRMLSPLSAHKLCQGFRQSNQGLSREGFAFIGEFAPQPLETVWMPGQSPHIRVREGALIKPAYPRRDRSRRRALRMAHGAGAHATVIGKVPERRDVKLGIG